MSHVPDGPTVDRRLSNFCYQTLASLDALRDHFTGQRRTTATAIYVALTESAQRLDGPKGRNGFQATRGKIAERAGVTTETLDRYVKEFVEIGMVTVERRSVGPVNLPNVWALHEPDTPPGVREPATLAYENGDLTRDPFPEPRKEAEEGPPISPQVIGVIDTVERETVVRGDHLAEHLVATGTLNATGEKLLRPKNRPTKVDRKPVTDHEYELAQHILNAFNDYAGTRYTSSDYIAKIIMRIREQPTLGLHQHEGVIQAALADPWWRGPASPSVIYGNAGLFERTLHGATSRGNGPLTPEEIETMGTEWGPGTPHETLAAARWAQRPDIEGEATEVHELNP